MRERVVPDFAAGGGGGGDAGFDAGLAGTAAFEAPETFATGASTGVAEIAGATRAGITGVARTAGREVIVFEIGRVGGAGTRTVEGGRVASGSGGATIDPRTTLVGLSAPRGFGMLRWEVGAFVEFILGAMRRIRDGHADRSAPADDGGVGVNDGAVRRRHD